jgi:hypothetical protein
LELELISILKVDLCHGRKGTYGEYTLSENDDVHVERIEVRGAVLILIKAAETDKVVVPEELDLLARLFHLYVFCCQRMNGEDL